MKNSDIFSYDVMSYLRKRPDKQAAVQATLERVHNINLLIKEGKATTSDKRKELHKLIPLSGYNFGFLIPTMFPRYPLDESLKFTDRPFMFAMSCLAPGSVVTLKAGRQVGKCADGSTKVTTNRGTMTLRDLYELGVQIPSAL